MRVILGLALLMLTGCGSTLSQEGAPDRLTNLIKYTTPKNLGPQYYADEHYDGPNPAREILDELDPASR